MSCHFKIPFFHFSPLLSVHVLIPFCVNLKMIERDFTDVCDTEAVAWRVCLETNLGSKTINQLCSLQLSQFDRCVATWREEVGDSVQLKGENQGEPPFQCAAISCLIGECLRKYNYDFDRCTPHTNFFKHCVRSFYGEDYIS